MQPGYQLYRLGIHEPDGGQMVAVMLNGFLTGLILQIAIGPVFFFILNISMQKTIIDGLFAVIAVTLVDYIFITVAVLGVGKLLEKPKIKLTLGIISSLVLILFGIIMILSVDQSPQNSRPNNLIESSYVSSFISAPSIKGSMPPSNLVDVAHIHTDAVVLDHLVGVQHIGADLAAPGDVIFESWISCISLPVSAFRAGRGVPCSTFMAMSLLRCWDFSCWHCTTMPVGRWVMRTALLVLLTCWPPAPLARNTSMRRSLSSMSTDDLVVQFRVDEHGGKGGVALAAGIEGRNAHQAVNPVFGTQVAEGVLAAGGKGNAFDAGLVSGLKIDQIES
jgi:hypothetical protein